MPSSYQSVFFIMHSALRVWIPMNLCENVIFVLSVAFTSSAIWKRGAKVRKAPIECPQQQQTIQSQYEGGAVQSRLAGYLMSLVFGLLWPRHIPSLLLLMCTGTERAMACAAFLALHFFPTLTSHLSLHPSLFHELTWAANAAPRLLCLFPTVPVLKTVSMLHVRFLLYQGSNISSVTQSLVCSVSPTLSLSLTHTYTHTLPYTHIYYMLDASCIMQNMCIQTSNLLNFQFTTSES